MIAILTPLGVLLIEFSFIIKSRNIVSQLAVMKAKNGPQKLRGSIL
ncbi:hypothetical protein RRR_05315 [Rickettsia rickettsii str. R]|nr:hypothetical protein RRR_05315 [Rickettsia rickettsii str. R]AJG35134.1 hypothetical protein RRM_05345 [Rickettsia rickettsii str. Morgan]